MNVERKCVSHRHETDGEIIEVSTIISLGQGDGTEPTPIAYIKASKRIENGKPWLHVVATQLTAIGWEKYADTIEYGWEVFHRTHGEMVKGWLARVPESAAAGIEERPS